GDDGPLPIGAIESRRAAVATDGKKVLTVYTRAGTNHVSGSDALVLVTDASPMQLKSTAPKIVSEGRNHEITRSISSNGKMFLLVWEDDRNADTGVDIYGLRVGLDGKAIDAAPFAITRAPGDQYLPAVAAIPGGDFLVVWSDERDIFLGNLHMDGR